MTQHKHEFPHSSSIQDVTYDEATKDMHITFVSGGKHRFMNVMKEDFDGFKTADSVGIHFHQRIRRKYASEKVE